MVHLAYILWGLGALIAKTPWLFHVFKYLGAGYLIFIGARGLMARKKALEYNAPQSRKNVSSFAVVRSGFLTSITNIKAMFYFLSLISAFITPNEPGAIVLIYGAIIFLSTALWFSCVALFFSHKRLRASFSSFHHWVERATGVLLTALGIRMLFIEAASL